MLYYSYNFLILKIGEEQVFLCRCKCNALKEFVTFSYLFKGTTWGLLSQTKESKPIQHNLVCYLFKHENGIGKCFRLEISNNSTNL